MIDEVVACQPGPHQPPFAGGCDWIGGSAFRTPSRRLQRRGEAGSLAEYMQFINTKEGTSVN